MRELQLANARPGTQIVLCNYARRLDGKRGAHWSPLSCATRGGSHVHIAEVAGVYPGVNLSVLTHLSTSIITSVVRCILT